MLSGTWAMTALLDLLAGLPGSFALPTMFSPVRADNPLEHGGLHTMPNVLERLALCYSLEFGPFVKHKTSRVLHFVYRR